MVWQNAEGVRISSTNGEHGPQMAALKDVEYVILDFMANPLLSASRMKEAADLPIECSEITVEKLYKFVMFSFLASIAVSAEKDYPLCRSFLYCTADLLSAHDCDGVVGPYRSLK